MAQEAGEGMGRSQARSSSRAVEGLWEKGVGRDRNARRSQSINKRSNKNARASHYCAHERSSREWSAG